MLQMQDQDKNLQEQLNEEAINNLSEKEFRVMIVKRIQNLRSRIEAQINRMEARTKKIQKCLTRTSKK